MIIDIGGAKFLDFSIGICSPNFEDEVKELIEKYGWKDICRDESCYEVSNFNGAKFSKYHTHTHLNVFKNTHCGECPQIAFNKNLFCKKAVYDGHEYFDFLYQCKENPDHKTIFTARQGKVKDFLTTSPNGIFG